MCQRGGRGETRAIEGENVQFQDGRVVGVKKRPMGGADVRFRDGKVVG